jgi:hypothetical protein
VEREGGIHCKKELAIFPSCRDVTDQTLSGREKTKLFPPRKSLISDIPAGDGKTANSFSQCRLNMELDLQSLFLLHVHSCTHWLRPRNSPLPPHLGSYTRALFVISYSPMVVTTCLCGGYSRGKGSQHPVAYHIYAAAYDSLESIPGLLKSLKTVSDKLGRP